MLVYSIARRTGLEGDEADDVFQQTFLALHRNLDRLGEPAAVPKWLAVTAAREALKIKRMRQRVRPMESLDELLAAEEAEAEEIALEGAESASIREALRRLGGRCEALLTMLYIEELAYQEIVDQGFAMGSIGPTRARCLDKLRKIVLQMGVFDVSFESEGGSVKQ